MTPRGSTLAHMRLALALAAAGAAALSSTSLVGCGKEDLPAATSASGGRTPRTAEPSLKSLAGKPDAGPKPPPDPCPGCGMG